MEHLIAPSKKILYSTFKLYLKQLQKKWTCSLDFFHGNARVLFKANEKRNQEITCHRQINGFSVENVRNLWITICVYIKHASNWGKWNQTIFLFAFCCHIGYSCQHFVNQPIVKILKEIACQNSSLVAPPSRQRLCKSYP